jgi:hypothetical protein
LISELSKPEIVSFIIQNENIDVNQLLLSGKEIYGVSSSLIANQIKGRAKAKEKLPAFYHNSQIIYPPQLNLEQSSSDYTAKFKADLVMSLISNREKGADLTGGFGVDSYYLSKSLDSFVYIEPNEELLEIAKHNHSVLHGINIAHINATAEKFLENNTDVYDFIYIDPSRREDGKKMISLKSCEPDVTMLQDQIFNISQHLLVKAAPLLDLQQGLIDLRYVKNVFVVSVDNECKEVLFHAEKNYQSEPHIHTINLIPKQHLKQEFNFFVSTERETYVEYSEPLAFLYEPNASILKAGAFKSIAQKYALKKIQQNTHLYTSEIFDDQFPGRIFKMLASIKPDRATLSKFFPEQKANITTRNYPMSVDELRKQAKLKDGGDKYLIGFTGINQKYLAVAERLK